MTDRFEKSHQANELRKSGQFQDAAVLYKALMNEGFDPYIAAGLLHCLRKQGLFEEALCICQQVLNEHNLNDWCKNEALWTLIQGRLEKLDESASLDEIISVAESILAIGPKDCIAKWRIVKPVLKSAKSGGRWDVVTDWVRRVDPEELSAEPRKDNDDRLGWSDQAIWHNYNIRSLIAAGDKDQAILLAQTGIDRFPRQSKFFRRLQALATLRLARLADAESVYGRLCNTARPEWWILREYAQVLRELGRPEEALHIMCKAAVSHGKFEMLVSLLADIGILCRELQMREDARNHLRLCKYVRQEQGWSIPHSVDTALSILDDELREQAGPANLKDCLMRCRGFWSRILGEDSKPSMQPPKGEKVRRGLRGKLIMRQSEKPFCFISSDDGDSYFCSKADLPQGVADGTGLAFDAVPSFDKKKNRRSWKAVNVRSIAPL